MRTTGSLGASGTARWRRRYFSRLGAIPFTGRRFDGGILLVGRVGLGGLWTGGRAWFAGLWLG
ncbi:MAG: hypothetical protein WBK99_10090, partial [Solirubrobacterales bacterium]